MKKYLLLSILLSCGVTEVFADTRFIGGTKSSTSLTNIDTVFPIDNTFINLETELYLGFVVSKFIDFNQFTFSFAPGAKIIQKADFSLPQSVPLDVNFYFYEAYLRYDTLSTSFSIGKSLLAWGQGTTRQFSFIVSDAFQDDIDRFYNAEILYRKDSTLVSLGIAFDTESVDILEKPEWYSPWLYIKHDQTDYTILSSFILNYDIDDGIDLKGSIEFQYFLPKNFEIYGTLAYLLLENNSIGKVAQINFLAGLKYEYRMDENFTLIPQVEYIVEQKNNILSFGFTALFYQLDLTLFNTFEYYDNDEWLNSLLTRISWNANKHFKVLLEHRAFFFKEQVLPITINHAAELKLEIYF